jgi:neutral ceramidase
MNLQIGQGKKEIQCFFKGLGMMGYGQPHNKVNEQATPLWSRAVCFKDSDGKFFTFINIEMAFVSIALKEKVVFSLQEKFPEAELNLANIMICAQHTHSAPGGFSHYPFYNFTIPGFRPEVFDAIVNSCVEAVTAALQNLQNSKLKLGRTHIEDKHEVAFNRSLSAYLNNIEMLEKERKPDKAEAVNREMQALNVYTASGKLTAHLNWFGVHCTSISSFNNKIHHDNKGIAAALFEKQTGAMALFSQHAAGDISPNFIWDKKLKRMRGKYFDQYESAAYNGEIQKNHALDLVTEKEIQGLIKYRHAYFDMTEAAAAPAHGVSFFTGTLEGPGVSTNIAYLLKLLSRSVRFFKTSFGSDSDRNFYKAQGKKDVLLDHRNGEFISISLNLWKKLPEINDPTLHNFIKQAKSNSINTLPWVPALLPIQIVEIGDLAILGVPGEITTMSAQRLKNSMAKKLGTQNIIISSYANGYMGYITTPEEYDLQCYEGGHTVYGRNSLPALINAFEQLCDDNVPQKSCFKFPQDELLKRSAPHV